MPSPAPPRIVVFDLGGVLVRIVRSWTEAHAAAGLPPHSICEAEAFDRARRELAQAHQVGAITPSEYYAGIARVSRGAYTAEHAEAILTAWQSEEYPGVDAVVTAIEDAGAETGALSNTNAAHWAVLRPDVSGAASAPRFPTVARLRHAHASHLLRLAKPDPAIYGAFEGATGFAASDILFFDDLEENVAAAQARGWRAEVIDHAGDTASQLQAHLEGHGLLRD